MGAQNTQEMNTKAEKPGLISRFFSFFGKSYVPVNSAGGWRSIVFEPFAGAWQRNIAWKAHDVTAYHAVFACMTLIASDIAKLRINVTKKDSDGIWNILTTIDVSWRVLMRPNSYQNRIQFLESWMLSKLSRGNTYVLIQREGGRLNGPITGLHILNPDLVLPMIAPNGDVFYQLGIDNLAGVTAAGLTVPASEIIHDRFNCIWHPLVGLSPIYACGLTAYNGLKIQENSAFFFKNMSRPSGVLTAPGAISDETAVRLKRDWEANFSANEMGKMAVLGDNLKYEPINLVTAEQSQLIDQLKLTADIVCSTFHVPAYKIGGTPPSYNNVEALDQNYYSQCLQIHIESMELCLKDGLDMPEGTEPALNIDGLLRMDSATQIKTLGEAVKNATYTPNEVRKMRNLKPKTGGDALYLQQQNFSLEALAKRDAREDPFAKEAITTEVIRALPTPETKPDLGMLALAITKKLKEVRHAESV